MAVNEYNQNDWGSAFCLAVCTMTIGQYYGTDVDMAKMKKDGAVSSRGSVLKPSMYFTRSAKKALSYSSITKEISNGKVCIVYMDSPYGGHYVVADDYTSASARGITVMDPWDGTHKQLNEAQFTKPNGTKYPITGYYTCTSF